MFVYLEFVSVLLLNGLISIYVNEFSNIYEQAKYDWPLIWTWNGVPGILDNFYNISNGHIKHISTILIQIPNSVYSMAA